MSARILLCTLVAAAGCVGGEPRPPCDVQAPIGTICGFRNPEDLEYLPSAGVVLVAGMRWDGPVQDGGFVSALADSTGETHIAWPRPGERLSAPEPALGDPRCQRPPDSVAFYPHGLTATERDGRTLVYVVGHEGALGGREAVEIFEFSGEDSNTELLWRACIPTKDAVQANDVVVTEAGQVIVSNFQPNDSVWHAIRAALFGTQTGNIMVWTKELGWRELEGTDAAMASGVAVTHDPDRLFYTEMMTGQLHRRPLAGNEGAIAVDIGGNPDNLTWTRRGTLLVATHTGRSALFLCTLGWAPCRSAWKVYEVDPDTLVTKLVLAHDGDQIGAVATALEVGKTLYLGSVYDDRIGVAALN